MNAKMVFVHALSPIHPGIGQGIGVIDLPVAREKATGLPYLPGSSFKGTLRDRCEDEKKRVQIFGPDTVNADEHAGAMQFSDQRLLLLPVRSLKGTFAWVTSPYLLRRLVRDAQGAQAGQIPTAVPTPESLEQCIVVKDKSAITLNQKGETKVILEDLDIPVSAGQDAADWATWLASALFPGEKESEWRTMLVERLCILHDDILSFLLQTATQVTARIRLQPDTKTVQKGGLWYEEALPAETVLSGLIVATPTDATGMKGSEIIAEIEKLTNGATIQFGGKATVGRGICRVHLV